MDYEAVVREFLTNFKEERTPSPKTILAYESDLCDFATFLQKNGINEQSVISYTTYLAGEKKLCDSTIRRKMIILKRFVEYMVAHGYIESACPMNQPPKIKQTKWVPNVLTTQEVSALLACAQRKKDNPESDFQSWGATRNMALIDILASTGIRVEEAMNMALTDIVESERLIVIHGKENKTRDIYLSCDETWKNLEDWLKVRCNRSVFTDKVFVSRGGMSMDIHSIERVYNTLRDEAGITPASTPHYLRHTFASNLLANGADLQAVQEIMGHLSASFTEAYIKAKPTQRKSTMDKFNYRNTLSSKEK